MTLDVRGLDAADPAAVAAYCSIRTSVDADDGETPESVAWEDATFPGQVWRFLAYLDGEPVGAASTGRLHIYGADHPRYYLGLWVLASARRRGTGTSLYRAASDVARAQGRTGFRCWTTEVHRDGIAFFLHRGFTEQDRSKAVALDLRRLRGSATAPLPAADVPAGFTLVTLGDQPELVAAVHGVAVEAFPSIPSTPPMDPGSLEEFTARDVSRPGIPLDGFFVAVETATGEVAGYANLIYSAGSTTVADHDMTAVRPAFRGRGLALALKRATIAWALEAGLDELHANNDEANAPMRSVNARLGYRPLPDQIGFAGPLAPVD